MKNPTPEQLKAEAIKKAWIAEIGEEIYNSVKSEISAVNGKLYYYVLTDNGFKPTNDRFENMQNLWWPKSIHGIENNKGWTRIEPDGSNLPKGSRLIYYEVGTMNVDGTFMKRRSVIEISVSAAWEGFGITHFKEIESSQPIY